MDVQLRSLNTKLIAILVLIPLTIPPLAVSTVHAQGYPPVAITTNPAAITLTVGGTANTRINITSINGYTGTTTLTAATYPYPQVNVTINPTSVTLPSGGTATTTATVTANSTTTPATYTIRIYAHSGVYDTTHDFNATVTPGPTTTPDFRLTASQTSIPVAPGASTAVTVTATSLAGFTGDIDLTNLPVIGTVNTTRIHLNPGQVVNATITLVGDCPFTNPNVRQLFEIDAKSGARFHWISMLYFYQTSQPTFCFVFGSTQKIVIGSCAVGYITFGTLGGFDANVIMTAKSSLETAFFPSNDITVKQGISFSGEMQVAITVPSNTDAGNYTLTLTGISGSQSWTMNETIQAITGSYFTMTVSPTAVTIPQGSSKDLVISMTGKSNFQAHVELFPIPSNKNLTFSETPNGADLIVGTSYTTQVTLTINTSNLPVGNYTLWVQAETIYMPYVDQIQIVSVTVRASTPNILGLSPIVFYSIVGALVGASALVSAITIIFLRKKKLPIVT